MAWIDQRLYWKWVEDRKKSIDGLFIGELPPVPSRKRIDYVTIGKDIPGFEYKFAIGVWDNDVYTPIHRDELERRTRQYTFDPTATGAVLVTRPCGEAKYDALSETWAWVPSELS